MAALPTAEFSRDSFLAPVPATGRYAGWLYAVPYVTNAAMLYYRADVLAEAGARPPLRGRS